MTQIVNKTSTIQKFMRLLTIINCFTSYNRFLKCFCIIISPNMQEKEPSLTLFFIMYKCFIEHIKFPLNRFLKSLRILTKLFKYYIL